MRTESFDHPDFGLAGTGYTSTTMRGLVQADARLGDAVRVFLQASVARESGRKGGPRAFDESQPDLAQAYADLTAGRVTLRIGRQELASNGNRLLGLRDAAPLRRAFDGIRGEVRLGGSVATGFVARQVLNKPGTLDDRADAGDRFAGATLETPAGEHRHLGFFLFHRALSRAPERIDSRRTLGVRYQRADGTWDLTSQFAFQIGHAGAHPVRAWSGSVEIGRSLPARSLRLAIQLGAASGDRSGDRRIGTFDPLYPNLGVYSEAPIYFPANQVNLALRAEGRWRGWDLSANTVVLARMSRDDAVYGASGRPLVFDRGKGPVHGAIVELKAALPIGERIQLAASLVRSEPFGAVEHAGGRASTFGYLQIGRRF